MAKRAAPEVNAGSMADIAFLLLIFFLVTTTIETDSGLNRKLPPMEDQVDPPIIRQKNIFTVLVSKNDQLLVEEELADIKDLRSLAVEFLDNGGGVGGYQRRGGVLDYSAADRVLIDGNVFEGIGVKPKRNAPFPFETVSRGDPQFQVAVNVLMGVI